MPEPKPKTVRDILQLKERQERIVVLTAYDYPSALLADQAGVDMILVGDSLGMVVQGHPTTIPVTLDAMLYHVQAVTRAAKRPLVIADLPFLTYGVTLEDSLRNAGRLVQEGGARAVKLEGGEPVVATVERIVGAGIPVMGHLGLTPQSVHALGGFRVQARQADQARRLLENAKRLQDAGAFALVLESVPSEVARVVTAELAIPTIGIGAGPGCDGEVQIFHDLLGLYEGFIPRHTRRYAEVGDVIRTALQQYAADVRSRAFPTDANTFHQGDLEDPSTWK
jgi:3-methyl-2-oxobutanoate hydroxymethyltransferase